MERRDYLITQIQQLGRFIRLLIEKMQGKSSSLNLEQENTQQQEEFKEHLGFDMELLYTPIFEELKTTLLSLQHYNSENIELLADYMVLLTEKCEDSPLTLIHRIKSNALQLYDMLELLEKTYSVERQLKIENLKKFSQI